MSKFLKVLKTVAPTVASALGGPVAGLAVHTLGRVLGKEGLGEDELAEFILSHQNPEVFLQLKTAEIEFKKSAQELELNLEKIDLERDSLGFKDRISAREMASATKSRATSIISAIVIGMFGCIIVALFFVDIPEASKAVLYILIGAMSQSLTQVMNFHFGSSAGSKMKEAQIGDIINGSMAFKQQFDPPTAPIVDVTTEVLPDATVRPGVAVDG